ncbi:MAG: FHA domain-containing protein [Myxococcota bacterium]
MSRSHAQPSPEARFRLRIVSGKGRGREFHFDEPTIAIGRTPHCDLVLYDTGVSRNHCEILLENGHYVLRDIGSANGTFLNESLTTEAHLYDGDRVGVGPVTFEFSTDDVTSPNGPDRATMWEVSNSKSRRELEVMRTRAVESRVSEPKKLRLPFELPKVRRTTLLSVAVAILVIAAAATVSYRIISSQPRVDRSAEVFAVNESNAELRFGAGRVDVFTPRAANFAFDYTGGKATLVFAVGGIDSDSEVSIELNGKAIGHAPASPARWTAGNMLDLPRELLYKGRNLLAFRHHPLSGATARWGIAKVEVEESELPEVDVGKAQQLFALGKSAFDTRSVAPQNLARSIDYFGQARLYLEGIEERPPLYYDIGKSLKRAKGQLQNTFETHIFAAEQATRFGDRTRAVDSLVELLQYIPDKEDPRHIEAKSRLESLQE